jgi:hypothetical protein
VHVPPDGHPLPGYEQAKAEILARGGTVAGYGTYAESDPQVSSGGHKSLWAMLFGGADEEEDNAMASSGRGVTSRTASRQSTQVASLAPTSGEDNGVRAILLAQNQTQPSVPAAAEPAPSRSRSRSTARTTPQPAEQPVPAPAPQSVAVASAAPSSSGLTSFLDTLRGEGSTTGTVAAQSGTTVVARADAQPPVSTTVAAKEDASPDSDAKPGIGIVGYAPLPPRRSDALAELASLATIPVPPPRPANLDAGEPKEQPPAADSGDAGKLVALDHPLPPARPQVFALASPSAGAGLSDITPATASIQSAGTLVPLDHPLPPSRPVQFAMTSDAPRGPAIAGAAASAAPRGLDKEGILAVFETAALVPAHRPASGPIKVANAIHAALPETAQEAMTQPSVAVGHFSSTAIQPILNHFSGKAIQPLSAVGFAKSE